MPVKMWTPEQIPPVIRADPVTHGTAVALISATVGTTDQQVNDENDHKEKDDGTHPVSRGVTVIIAVIIGRVWHISAIIIVIAAALVGRGIQYLSGNVVKRGVQSNKFGYHTIDCGLIVP